MSHYARNSSRSFTFTLAAALALLFLLLMAAPTRAAGGEEDASHPLYTPLSLNQYVPPPALDWDPRLNLRGAAYIPAQVQPGQGYWRLVKAVWFDKEESGGRHHIYVDVLSEAGERQVGAPVQVSWNDGATTIITEAKPGEAYAANFAMYALAPAYAAQPHDGATADAVTGMGLGDIEDPYHAVHTSYGLTWRWTLAPY